MQAGTLGFRLYTTALILPAAKTQPSLKMPKRVATPIPTPQAVTDEPSRQS